MLTKDDLVTKIENNFCNIYLETKAIIISTYLKGPFKKYADVRETVQTHRKQQTANMAYTNICRAEQKFNT